VPWSPADFLIEIIKARPQGIETFDLGPVPTATPIDVTNRTDFENLGAVNRAMERDLLSFKTGDMTLTFFNEDGFFDDLFAPSAFGATDIWGLRVWCSGEVQFYGCLIGLGSILFQRKDRKVEITAYGLTKILDMTSAEGAECKRSFLSAGYTLNGNHGAGAITLTITTGAADFVAGDIWHITDHNNKEDVTIRQRLNSTQVLLEAGLSNPWLGGTAISIMTPFHRFRTIDFLVRQLNKQAGFAMLELRINPSQFSRLAPTPINIGGLPVFTGSTPTLGNQVYTNPAEISGARVESLGGDGAYSQATPDAVFVREGTPVQSAWVDWSRYYSAAETPPTTMLRCPALNETITDGAHMMPHNVGWDFRSATKVMYFWDNANRRVLKRTSADGLTWAAASVVTAAGIITGWSNGNFGEMGCELDQARGMIYAWTTTDPTIVRGFGVYDIAGATWTDLRQPGDAADAGYGGVTYVPELDCVICLRSTLPGGPNFEVLAFRGAVLLWRRPFPSCYVQDYGSGPPGCFYNWPTHSLRMVNGRLYCVVISDGKAQFVSSDDQFQTYTMKALTDPGVGPRCFGARVNGAYQISCWKGTSQRGKFIAAPFYAGVIEYADFEGLSVAEGLKKLSILANALPFVDDDLGAHFVARDLYDAGDVLDITDRILEQTDDTIWDQTAQFVTVSGNGVDETAGDHDFSADGISLDSSFIPNPAFGHALAEDYFTYYSQQRQFQDGTVIDTDGHIYRPLGRVMNDGTLFLVQESDHDLMSNEVRLGRLENR
jgi:hypothetical protein